MIGGKQPTAREKKLWSLMARVGCIVTGSTQFQLHHIKGSTFKFKKVHVGNIWMLPLHYELHDIGSNSRYNVTKYPDAFREKYGNNYRLLVKLNDRCRELEPDADYLLTDDELALAKEYFEPEHEVSDWEKLLGVS